MRLGWKVFLPFTLLFVALCSGFMLAFDVAGLIGGLIMNAVFNAARSFPLLEIIKGLGLTLKYFFNRR